MANAKALYVRVQVIWINEDWVMVITHSGKKSATLLSVADLEYKKIEPPGW